MKTQLQILLLLVINCPFATVSAQSDFGRFYTTPRQRTNLEEMRSQQPDEEIVITVDTSDFPEQAVAQEVAAPVDSIIVNGLVYRTDGKNTAWINSNSTIEGSIENQYTRVRESDVHPHSVGITLPDNVTEVELKVGQQYDVRSGSVYDLMKEPGKLPPVRGPEGLQLPPGQGPENRPLPPPPMNKPVLTPQ